METNCGGQREVFTRMVQGWMMDRQAKQKSAADEKQHSSSGSSKPTNEMLKTASEKNRGTGNRERALK